MKRELAFYVGCVNLHEALSALGETVCFPIPRASGSLSNDFRGLFNPCLSLNTGRGSVRNDVRAAGKRIVIITGVNEGGKTTLLRSLGLARLMAQAGMFVAADSCALDVCAGVFTHYRRREDRGMESGKFDEELSRMSGLADQLRPGSLILFNESFSSTNEREGTEVARQILAALMERDIQVCFVTHMYSLASLFADSGREDALLLKAERGPEGGRTFRIVEGMPSRRGYGSDLYKKIFGNRDEDGSRDRESRGPPSLRTDGRAGKEGAGT